MSIQTTPSGTYQPWRHGWGLPTRWTSTVDPGGAYLGRLEMSFDGDAGPRCDRWQPLRRNGSPWPSSSAGQALPPLWKVAAVDAAAVRVLAARDGQAAYAILGGDPDRTDPVGLATSSGRRCCPLVLVATLYGRGVDHRDGLSEVVVKLHVAESTAHELINECRELGLLPPTSKHTPPGADAAVRVIYGKLEVRSGEDYWTVPAGPRAGTKIPRRFINPDAKPGDRLGAARPDRLAADGQGQPER